MALKLWYSDALGGNWQLLNNQSAGLCNIVLDVSLWRPARLSFRLHAPQHQSPIPQRAMVIFVDTDYSPHLTHPVFEGHVYSYQPTESNAIDYTCFDQTMRARGEITILNGPHADPVSSPRLVYNSKIDNDDDRAMEFRHDATVGQIIRDILTFSYNELVSNCQAAPPVTIGGDAFIASDLTPFDFVPQEKVVFESQLLGEGLDRLLAYYPQYRVVFHPGQAPGLRTWRFINVHTAPQTTLTLNDHGPLAKRVLAMTLEPLLEGRFTAVKIVGPPKTAVDVVYQEDESATSGVEGGLIPLWSIQEELNFSEFGPASHPDAIGDCARRWQIADPAKRRLARLLPHEVVISGSEFNVAGTDLLFKRTRRPTLQATFDQGETWWTVNGITLDLFAGIITAPNAIHQFADLSSASASDSTSIDPDMIGNFRVPDNVRFTFAYHIEPVSVRYPATGFAGTAYSACGMTTEMRLYDEMLAVGYETGLSVTTPERQSQFLKLATQIHESRSNVAYSGGCVLAGLDYEFLRLNRRINFHGVNASGDLIVTGWESMDAILTDVEFDFETRLTTLTFGTDQGEFSHQKAARLRELLKIQALRLVPFFETRFTGGVGGYTHEFLLQQLLVESR